MKAGFCYIPDSIAVGGRVGGGGRGDGGPDKTKLSYLSKTLILMIRQTSLAAHYRTASESVDKKLIRQPITDVGGVRERRGGGVRSPQGATVNKTSQ